MADLAINGVERSIAVPGVQPKLSLSFIADSIAEEGQRLTVVGALEGNFILKPPSEHYPEMPQNEHVTMRIAEAFGIRTIPSSLISLKAVSWRISHGGLTARILMKKYICWICFRSWKHLINIKAPWSV